MNKSLHPLNAYIWTHININLVLIGSQCLLITCVRKNRITCLTKSGLYLFGTRYFKVLEPKRWYLISCYIYIFWDSSAILLLWVAIACLIYWHYNNLQIWSERHFSTFTSIILQKVPAFLYRNKKANSYVLNHTYSRIHKQPAYVNLWMSNNNASQNRYIW